MISHSKNSPPPPYKLSFTSGALFCRESVMTAEIYIQEKKWPSVQNTIIQSNLFQARTVSTLKRICREIISRLKRMSIEQLEIIAGGESQEQLQMLWIAVCKNYRFIHDFAVEVIREKYLTLDFSLTEMDYLSFFDAKAQWHEELDNLKISTKKKLKQVLFRMLREAGIISGDGRILPAILSKKTARALLSDPSGIYRVLPVSDTDIKEWAK